MSQNILEVKDLHVSVQDKEILKGVDLTIGSGETHVLMGPNGAGKSTLGFALMGNPRYEVTEGEITFNGQNIEDEPADKRARAGMFMSFQNPVEVPGLSVSSVLTSHPVSARSVLPKYPPAGRLSPLVPLPQASLYISGRPSATSHIATHKLSACPH